MNKIKTETLRLSDLWLLFGKRMKTTKEVRVTIKDIVKTQ